MLIDLLVSEVRVKMLSILLTNTDKPLHVRALVREVGTEINAVRRELKRLHELGLVIKQPSGNRIYYSANTGHYMFPELLALVFKEDGLAKILLEKKDKLGPVDYMFLSKGFLRGRA
jgi:DNA-binding transcriptional ArsR family regulator